MDEPTNAIMNKSDEYKLFIEDTARFSDRRQAASRFLIAANGFLVAGIAALITNIDRDTWWLLLLLISLLSSTGLAVSVIWLKLIRGYAKMIKFRVEQLQQIESQIADSHRMYYKIRKMRTDSHLPIFSEVEQWLPCTFIALYWLLFMGTLTAVGVLCSTRVLHMFSRLS